MINRLLRTLHGPGKVVIAVGDPPSQWVVPNKGPLTRCISSCCLSCGHPLLVAVYVEPLEGRVLGVLVSGTTVDRVTASSARTFTVTGDAKVLLPRSSVVVRKSSVTSSTTKTKRSARFLHAKA